MWAVCTSDGGFQHLLTLAFLTAFALGLISSSNLTIYDPGLYIWALPHCLSISYNRPHCYLIFFCFFSRNIIRCWILIKKKKKKMKKYFKCEIKTNSRWLHNSKSLLSRGGTKSLFCKSQVSLESSPESRQTSFKSSPESRRLSPSRVASSQL